MDKFLFVLLVILVVLCLLIELGIINYQAHLSSIFSDTFSALEAISDKAKVILGFGVAPDEGVYCVYKIKDQYVVTNNDYYVDNLSIINQRMTVLYSTLPDAAFYEVNLFRTIVTDSSGDVLVRGWSAHLVNKFDSLAAAQSYVDQIAGLARVPLYGDLAEAI